MIHKGAELYRDILAWAELFQSIGVRVLSSLSFLSTLLMTGKGFEAVSCYYTMANMLSKKGVAMFSSFGGHIVFSKGLITPLLLAKSNDFVDQ